MTANQLHGGIVWPTVSVGEGPGRPLSGVAARCLAHVEVDTHLLLPAMFVLCFEDLTGRALDEAGLDIGARVQVSVGAGRDQRLVVGEVTAVEGSYHGLAGQTVVRGYDLCHRLQRARRTRSFDDATDADIARRIAAEARLPVGEITETEVVHEHLLQCNQTDWEFLAQRAAETGFEFGMADGRFHYRRAAVLAQSAQDLPELTVPGSLLRFEPRVTAGNLTPDVEVRVWDPLRAALSAAAPVPASATGASAPRRQQLAEVTELFRTGRDGNPGEERAAVPTGPSDPAGPDTAPPPSPTAHVVSTLPVAGPEAAAAALAASVGGTFAEAEGEALGDGAIRPGASVRISGIPNRFPEVWLVNRSRHVFDLTSGGYRTEFAAGGVRDRSLLGLASASAPGGGEPVRIPGLVCALVDDIGDGHARVRLTLPWLSPDVRTDWAPVVQFGAGRRSGAMFLPEVGDQVLVGFEFGDPRRPYVLGGIVTEDSSYSLGGEAVRRGPGGADSSVARRGFVSASGNRLVFLDEMGEAPEPEGAQILLGSGDGAFGLGIDTVHGSLELSCSPPEPGGRLTIRCGEAGTVNIVTGPGGTVTVDGGDELTLTAAASLTIRSQGTVSVSAPSIALGG
ncbi:phage baseplate assembly protein V [Kitasatospora viridis]|uniref:Phage protein D n=1 Tax=Kitasatospora viridis TaxID=281105 RepID=A0A561TV46_9ACTN|nr:phage baseplate assembly protein V [Kitasatospora viridis]TWF90988.1 phage protein D [Kitasatospora viridis]